MGPLAGAGKESEEAETMCDEVTTAPILLLCTTQIGGGRYSRNENEHWKK